MLSEKLLFKAIESSCPFIHQTRLNAVMDVAQALRNGQNLSLSKMGRHLSGNAKVKNKIKKVDRLEGNQQLHEELFSLYRGLSDFVFTYLSQNESLPILIDVCFMKDDRAIQMLSAELATKGRSIPIYREVFSEGELKDKTASFLKNLKRCLPEGREIIVIMDAGFYEEWFKTIESYNWYWICRIRQGKTTSKIASGRYSSSGREPWILACNLPSDYRGPEIVKMYTKRMQIEESFRDVKSHQFGLCGRYIRTKCTHRWGVKMLLAAITQITYWILSVIAHSQGMQELFQANTVKEKKIFSYFTLGRLLIEHDMLHRIKPDDRSLAEIMRAELAREW